ncbi:hypothetical protein F5884DRAFT_791995 [Xylogone sp. PMI_703]|nr:hypothetical protein F5884DRAFT_791995 [Xylogone sp. PMI_703]
MYCTLCILCAALTSARRRDRRTRTGGSVGCKEDLDCNGSIITCSRCEVYPIYPITVNFFALIFFFQLLSTGSVGSR